MASLNIPYSFTNGTPSNATEVNSNFSSIKSFVEGSLVQTDGSVKADTIAIADDAITSAKIASNAVGTTEIANDAVTSDKIAANAVGTSEIANDAVTADKVADGATLPVNITGNAATASSASSASTASVADEARALAVPGLGSVYNSGGEFYCNTNLGVSGNINSYGAIWYFYPQSSSSTNYIIQRSDGRLCFRSGTSLLVYKEDVKPIDSGLDLINSLQPKSFVFKEEHTDMDDPFEVFARRTQRQYGFVVDDILEVDSDLIDHDYKDGEMVPRMWKHEAILANAVAAIQELSAKVDALQAEVDSLKNG